MTTVTEARINHYEGMFLFPQAASADLGGSVAHIKEILDRAGAEIIALKKWDDRRLAYEIAGQKRGVFILVYFTADARKLALVERACNLSEKVLRQLVTRADHLTVEEMKSADAQEDLNLEAMLRAAAEPREEAPPVEAAPRAEAPRAEAPREETAQPAE